MMHLVMEGAERQPVAVLHHQPFETGVRGRGRQREILQMVDDVHGMGRYDPVDQNGTEIENVLDRMHRHSRPWTDVGVSVMQGMRDPVEGRPVQHAVNPVEVERLPHRHQEEQRDEPDRAVTPVQIGGIPVGHAPHHQDLVSRPHGDAAGAGPDHVVEHLIIQREGTAVLL